MSAPKRKAPGATGAQENTNEQNFSSSGAAAQRARILDRLLSGPATTIQLRRDLDVMMPAARIFELRHNFGHTINTLWTSEETQAGRLHRVARYCLQAKGAR